MCTTQMLNNDYLYMLMKLQRLLNFIYIYVPTNVIYSDIMDKFPQSC